MSFTSGLCSTCALADTCIYHKNQQEIIWRCEEFSTRVSVELDTHEKKIGLKAAPGTGKGCQVTVDEEEHIAYKGLCVNCENRKICKREIVEGGIWHCELYAI